MNDKQREVLNMLGRVATFGRDNSAAFPSGSRGARLLSRLDAAIAAATSAATVQNSAGGAILTKSLALLEVQNDMRAIARTAHSIDAEERPGTAADFALPKGSSAADWLSRAGSFHEKSESLRALFLDFAMRPDFREDLAADIAAYENATDDSQSGAQNQVGGTAGLSSALSEGMKVVQQLDGLCANLFASDAATMGAWNTARHIVRADRKTKTAATPVPTP